jgi:DNA replication protein DnaC
MANARKDPWESAEPAVKEWTCPEHGERYGYDLPTPGRITWECLACEKAARDAVRDWETQWRRYHYWDRESNIPFRFRNRTLANWARDARNEVVGAALDRYAAKIGEKIETGAGMTLLGPPGLGKTHILTALVSIAIREGASARYAVWPDVVTMVKNNFNLRRDEERSDPIEPLKTAKLLALDELALKPSSSEFETGLLFELIDYRYRERLCTLVASNATAATLADAVGPRIADRLTECSPAVMMSGASRRAGAEGSTAGEWQMEPPPDEVVIRVHTQGKWREKPHSHERGRYDR